MKTLETLKTLFAFTIIFLTFSCSKNDQAQPTNLNDKTPTYLLEKFSSSVSGLKSKFIFNDLNLPIQAEYYNGNVLNSISYITYTNGKIDKITKTDGYLKYSYNSNGKFDKILNYSVNGNTETLTSTILYDYSNNVIESTKNQSNVLTKKLEYVFDTNSNLIEIKRYTVNASNPNGVYLNSTYFSDYDDKKNPNSTLPESIAFPSISKNNYRKIVDLNVTDNFTYNYDEKGFAISQTKTGQSEVFRYDYLIK